MENFEHWLADDLHRHLLAEGEVDDIRPQCPDVEEKWPDIAQAYMPDGIREFNDFPTASLGWMMYLGMALAKYWDAEWSIYSHIDDLYGYIRNKRGYDAMDEYILHDELQLRGKQLSDTEKRVGECASRVYHALMHQHDEPGSREALVDYVSCLKQLYLAGMAMQLKRMGYHMTAM